MKYTTILMDLDGTLLGMDEDLFTKAYFKRLCAKMAPHGYEPERLVSVIWKGTKAMVQNDGKQSNEEVFWRVFAEEYGQESQKDYQLFVEFYENEFDGARSSCETVPGIKEMVETMRSKGYRLVIATNPIFPSIATRKRIAWATLDPDMFELVTTYENSTSAKPSPAYYQEILAKLNLSPQECLMVGNDAHEDGIARSLGIDVFLFPKYLINRKNEDISSFLQGGPAELLAYLEKTECC